MFWKRKADTNNYIYEVTGIGETKGQKDPYM